MRRKQIETKFIIFDSDKEYLITIRDLLELYIQFPVLILWQTYPSELLTMKPSKRVFLHILAFLYLDVLFVRELYK